MIATPTDIEPLQLCDISVRTWKQCMFNKKYIQPDGTPINNWDQLYTDYVDMSGIGETAQFNLYKQIHNLQTRLTDITWILELQRSFFQQFNFAFLPGLALLEKYNHKGLWNAQAPDGFLPSLLRVESKEKRNIAELDSKMKELDDLMTKGVRQDASSRKDFIRMINRLGKEGYKIDDDKTDMESVSLMIKESADNYKAQMDEVEARKNRTH